VAEGKVARACLRDAVSSIKSVFHFQTNILRFVLTLQFRIDKGLYYSTGELDWGRSSVEGFNLSCNIPFHETLLKMAPLATLLASPDLASQWLETASMLKPNLERFWDPSIGLYMDNLNAPYLYPQDGNSLAC
jgi:hypothetical protein